MTPARTMEELVEYCAMGLADDDYVGPWNDAPEAQRRIYRAKVQRTFARVRQQRGAGWRLENVIEPCGDGGWQGDTPRKEGDANG